MWVEVVKASGVDYVEIPNDLKSLPVETSIDINKGVLASGSWTLTTANTVYSVTLPDAACRLRLRATADSRFALNENPGIEGAGAFQTGGTLRANVDYVRAVAPGVGRTLRLLSATAGAKVYVEWFI